MLQDEGGGGGGGWDGFRNIGLNAIFVLILFMMFDDTHNVRGQIGAFLQRMGLGVPTQQKPRRRREREAAAPAAASAGQSAPVIVWRNDDEDS